MTDDYEALRAAAESELKDDTSRAARLINELAMHNRHADADLIERLYRNSKDLTTTRTALLRAEGERDEARADARLLFRVGHALAEEEGWSDYEEWDDMWWPLQRALGIVANRPWRDEAPSEGERRQGE